MTKSIHYCEPRSKALIDCLILQLGTPEWTTSSSCMGYTFGKHKVVSARSDHTDWGVESCSTLRQPMLGEWLRGQGRPSRP